MSPIKAAVVQAAPVLFDTPKTLSRLADLARDAAGKGAELVAFPEAFVGGYPKGLDLGARLGTRNTEGREDFRPDVFSLSVDARPKPAVAFTRPHSLSIADEAAREGTAQGERVCSA